MYLHFFGLIHNPKMKNKNLRQELHKQAKKICSGTKSSICSGSKAPPICELLKCASFFDKKKSTSFALHVRMSPLGLTA